MTFITVYCFKDNQIHFYQDETSVKWIKENNLNTACRDETLWIDINDLNTACGFIENGINCIVSFTHRDTMKDFHKWINKGKAKLHLFSENGLPALFEASDNANVNLFKTWLENLKTAKLQLQPKEVTHA